MRYHWGLAVGHVYTHLSKLAEDSTPEISKSESNDDPLDHQVSEHDSGVHDLGDGLEETGGDEELWRHWDELVSDEDKSLGSDSDSVILGNAIYESDSDRDSHGDEGLDLDFYEF